MASFLRQGKRAKTSLGSTYEVLQKTVASSPEQPARCFLPLGEPSQPGEALTARAFLGKVHQSANLLADLGMGPQDVMALLLPDLLEKELLLWGGQAAGIVCPIPACLPTPQIVELLQAARAKVLVGVNVSKPENCTLRVKREGAAWKTVR